MKASAQGLVRLLSLISLALIIASCAVGARYQDRTQDINDLILSGDFSGASESLDKNKFLSKSKNRLLYLMEKGKVEHMNGNYEASNKYLEEAYILIDDGIRTGVGRTVTSKLVNPMQEPYKGEDFEKVIIHYYKALNYFYLNDSQAALVEAKRINIKLLALNDKYTNHKNKYAQDAFSQILQGILYEATGDINNAFIAYRNAETIYYENDGNYFDVPIPLQLKKDILRTSKAMGFRDEYNFYKKRYPEVKEEPFHPGEAIVFWENGQGPQKSQTKLSATTAGGVFVATYDDGEEDLVITLPAGSSTSINVIAIPKYEQRESYYSDAFLIAQDNKEYPLQIAEDFYAIAKQSLRDRMLREVADLIIRFSAKKAASFGLSKLAEEIGGKEAGKITQILAEGAGALLEEADTRNWQTLPATISYTRVPLRENEINIFTIKKIGPTQDSDILEIPYKKGLQIVSYFDLGRTIGKNKRSSDPDKNDDPQTEAEED